MRPAFSIAVGTDAVREIVPSLDGREAVVVLGDKRAYFMEHVSGAVLLRIEGEGLALGAAPERGLTAACTCSHSGCRVAVPSTSPAGPRWA